MASRTWPPKSLRSELRDVQSELPSITIDDDMPLSEVIQTLAHYFVKVIDVPHSFEELRSAIYGHALAPLIDSLSGDVHHQAILPALLALRGHFAVLEDDDDRHLNLTRAYACELVAFRFTTRLSEGEALDYLLHDLPPASKDTDILEDPESLGTISHVHIRLVPDGEVTERSQLLNFENRSRDSPSFSINGAEDGAEEHVFAHLAASLAGLNALEIATITDSKKFLSQRAVQRIIDGVWNGTYVFWDTLSLDTKKKPRKYSKIHSDPYCRLRVPKYLKIYEVLFFAVFLVLYYIVLLQRNPDRVTGTEILLFIWLAAFAYDELSQYVDAGLTFYATDFWSLWDFGIVAIGIAFLIMRVVGLVKHDHKITDTSFDVLALEALLLVPRICSLLSLQPFFGTLIPCLREMTKYSTKFLGLVIILYLGFLSTFTLLARDYYTVTQMAWILIKVFFGSSYIGFDAADKISPVVGLPLMLIFVWLTNILLLTSLISLLSNSLSEVMAHARDEYLFLYSVFVLEASTSNRLTYFYPPLNLVSLAFRPLRLFVSTETMRRTRILVLKITHFPHVMIIKALENLVRKMTSPPRVQAAATLRRSLRRPLSTLNATASLQSSPAYSTAKIRFSMGRSVSTPPQTWKRTTGQESPSRPNLNANIQISQLAEQIESLKSTIEDLVSVVARQQDQAETAS